jgi:zinc protease
LPAKADLVAVPDAPPPQAKFIDFTVPNAAQTTLRFAGAAPKRADPDYLAAFIASFILGGGSPGTRLYDAVRVQRGLAYSIGLNLDVAEHAGWFLGSTSTRVDQADEVLKIIQDEIKRYAEDGPTTAELTSAKAYVIGSYPLRFVTTRQVASQMIGVLIGNLGIDYINKRNELIAAVTLDDVKRMAKRLFSGPMLISRVGPAPT